MTNRLPESSIVFHVEIPHPFTLNEIRIIHLSLCGYTSKEIADKFFVKTNTIYQVRKSAIKKVSTGNFNGVTGWVVSHGIFTSVEKAEKAD